MYVQVTLAGSENADLLARRLVGDLMSSSDLSDAQLVRAPAAVGEKGIIEQFGAIGVSLMTSGGADVLLDCLKGAFAQMTSGPSEKTIIIEMGDKRAELRGTMSNAEFSEKADEIIAMLKGG